jgi:hypothetical protein
MSSTELVRAQLRRQRTSAGMVIVSAIAAALFARKRVAERDDQYPKSWTQ